MGISDNIMFTFIFCCNFSRTPLHWATVCEKPDVLRALMAARGTQDYIYPSI